MNKLPFSKKVLYLGAGLVIPCYLYTVLNTLFSPWPLYERSRPALLVLTPLCLALLLLLFHLCAKYESFLERHERALTWGVVLLFLVFQLTLGCMLAFNPLSDQYVCYYGAKEWVKSGAPSAQNLDLLAVTPNNFALLVLQMLLQKLLTLLGIAFKDDLHAATAVFNALLFIPGFLCLMSGARMLGGVRAKAAAAAGMMTCLPLYYCTAQMYTDALTMPFIMIALYLLLRMARAKTAFAAHGFAAAAAVVLLIGLELRVTVLILFIAALISALFLFADKRRLLCFVTCIVILAAGNSAFMKYRDEIVGKERLDQLSMPIVHWLVLGAPDPYGVYYGQFTSDDYLFATGFDTPQERDSALWNKLKERVYQLRRPAALLSAVSRKNLSTFGDGTFELDSQMNLLNRAPKAICHVLIDQTMAHRIYQHICTGFFAAYMLAAAYSCLRMIKARRMDFGRAMIMITLVGAFVFLTLWETKARYFFNFVPILILAGALLEPGSRKEAA